MIRLGPGLNAGLTEIDKFPPQLGNDLYETNLISITCVPFPEEIIRKALLTKIVSY